MKKSYFIFILLFFIIIGYATLSTVLDIKGNIKVAENIEDFKIEITNLSIDNSDSKNLISKDKHSFTFTGTSNDNINYTVTNYSYQYDANITLICNPSDNITIEQINTLSAQDRLTKTITSKRSDEITCTINIEKISRTEYAEDMCKYDEGQVWTFNYTGSEQTFTVPCDGEYKIELWGARGGENYGSANGAYTKGETTLDKNLKIYLYIGKNGDSSVSSGTLEFNYGYQNYTRSGGGATDIRLVNGTWNSTSSLVSRIMVAGGGGSAGGLNSYDAGNPYGGSAGGLVGYQGGYVLAYPNSKRYNGSMGATQTSGHAFGFVPLLNSGGNTIYNNPGGNGYWSGNYYNWAANPHSAVSGAGGGSSFISGHNGCIAISSEGNTSPRTDSKGNKCANGTTDITCSYHYSGHVFTNTVMIDGAGYKWTTKKESYTGMPTYDGASTMTGNSGNGYAKITYLG